MLSWNRPFLVSTIAVPAIFVQDAHGPCAGALDIVVVEFATVDVDPGEGRVAAEHDVSFGQNVACFVARVAVDKSEKLRSGGTACLNCSSLANRHLNSVCPDRDVFATALGANSRATRTVRAGMQPGVLDESVVRADHVDGAAAVAPVVDFDAVDQKTVDARKLDSVLVARAAGATDYDIAKRDVCGGRGRCSAIVEVETIENGILKDEILDRDLLGVGQLDVGVAALDNCTICGVDATNGDVRQVCAKDSTGVGAWLEEDIVAGADRLEGVVQLRGRRDDEIGGPAGRASCDQQRDQC